MFADGIRAGYSRAEFVELGLTQLAYHELRNLLNGKVVADEQLRIVAIRGRTGGLSTVPLAVAPQLNVGVQQQVLEVETASDQVEETELRLERQYYTFAQIWAREAGFANCIITGGQIPGFKWENPDLLHVDHWIDEITNALGFDITAFEVKLRVEPSAVWQAANYNRFAQASYVAFAKSAKEVREKDDGRVFELAVELGMGVLAFDAADRRFFEIQSPRLATPNQLRVTETLQNFRTNEAVEVVVRSAIQARDTNIQQIVARALQPR